MDSKTSNNKITADIPTQIFEKFLEELKSAEIPTEIVGRLKGVLSNKEIPNEVDIKNALFSDI